MAKIAVERQLLISGGRLGSKPWVVKDVEKIEGSDYATIAPKDTGLRRFLLGQSKYVADRALKDIIFLDDLKAGRNNAMKGQFSTGEASAYRMRQSVKKAKLAEQSKTVQWTFPAVVGPDGEQRPETTIRFKRVDHENASVMMMMSEESLGYLYAASHARGWREVSRNRPAKLDVPVRWDNQKAAWLARRPDPKYRLFRPKDTGPCSMEHKRRRAEAWAQGDSDLSGSDAPGAYDEGEDGDAEPDDGAQPEAEDKEEQQQKEPALSAYFRIGASASGEHAAGEGATRLPASGGHDQLELIGMSSLSCLRLTA